MTTALNLPRVTSRQEGDGYVVYLPDTGRYLYANASANQVLADLRAGRSSDEVSAALAEHRHLRPEHSSELVAALIDVLLGRRDRVQADDGLPQLGPLSDLVGDSADRCETFGMPL